MIDLREFAARGGARHLHELEDEERVRAAALRVHLRRRRVARRVARLDQRGDRLVRVDRRLLEPLDVGPEPRVLAHLERRRLAARADDGGDLRVEEVVHVLVVDLDVRRRQPARDPLALLLRDLDEELAAEARDEPLVLRRPHHRVRLPEPVCPYANIEQLKLCHAASSIDVPRSPCTSCCEWKVSPSGSCESYT